MFVLAQPLLGSAPGWVVALNPVWFQIAQPGESTWTKPCTEGCEQVGPKRFETNKPGISLAANEISHLSSTTNREGALGMQNFSRTWYPTERARLKMEHATRRRASPRERINEGQSAAA